MRNLSGASPANPCWPCQPAAACAAAGPCGSSGAFCFIPVVPGVLLCWLARSLPCVRYKILPAWLLGGENGIKLSLHAEKAPNWAISGEQGEFCTAHAARAGVQGEFCTAHAVRRGVRGEFCTGHAARRGVRGEFCTGHAVRRGVRGEFCTGGARCGSCWESCVVLSRSLCAGWWAYGSALALLMGTAAGLSGSSGAPHAGGAGSLMGSAPEGLRLHARKSSPCVAVRS